MHTKIQLLRELSPPQKKRIIPRLCDWACFREAGSGPALETACGQSVCGGTVGGFLPTAPLWQGLFSSLDSVEKRMWGIRTGAGRPSLETAVCTQVKEEKGSADTKTLPISLSHKWHGFPMLPSSLEHSRVSRKESDVSQACVCTIWSDTSSMANFISFQKYVTGKTWCWRPSHSDRMR